MVQSSFPPPMQQRRKGGVRINRLGSAAKVWGPRKVCIKAREVGKLRGKELPRRFLALIFPFVDECISVFPSVSDSLIHSIVNNHPWWPSVPDSSVISIRYEAPRQGINLFRFVYENKHFFADFKNCFSIRFFYSPLFQSWFRGRHRHFSKKIYSVYQSMPYTSLRL